MNKLWEITLRWCKNGSPRLEISLFHYLKGDSLYFVYIQLYKLVFSVSFNIRERHLRRTGYYDHGVIPYRKELY